MLIAMGSSAIAVELHCLGPDGGGSRDQLMQMMDFFAEQLETGKNFEMLQSILHVFLKVRLVCSKDSREFSLSFSRCMGTLLPLMSS